MVVSLSGEGNASITPGGAQGPSRAPVGVEEASASPKNAHPASTSASPRAADPTSPLSAAGLGLADEAEGDAGSTGAAAARPLDSSSERRLTSSTRSGYVCPHLWDVRVASPAFAFCVLVPARSGPYGCSLRRGCRQ